MNVCWKGYNSSYLFFFLFGSCFSLWDHGEYLSRNFVKFAFYLVQYRVNLSLVINVNLWDCEEGDPWHNNESHGVEPASNICQNPKRESKFDRVHHVFNKEKATKFHNSSVQFVCCFVCELIYSFWCNGDIHSSVFCNWVGGFFL